jgi:hypothetical protein
MTIQNCKISEKIENSVQKLTKMVQIGQISPEMLPFHIKIEADLLKIPEKLLIFALERAKKC